MRARTTERFPLAPAVRGDIGLPLGSLRWMRLTRPNDLSHASLARLRYAVSAQTSEAVLSRVTASRSIRPLKRAPLVTLTLRMKP
ncbi:hypothetical protein [Sphingomonas sp.]|uniref:hypothetical protein n=1 Tax=Sphingomonas sp. TaxID=28214 RepID=UPI0031D8F216